MLFGWEKRMTGIPLENSRLIEDSIGWTDSPEDALSDQVMDAVWTILEEASINARKRKIIWAEGQRQSTSPSNAFTPTTRTFHLS
jgi:hypothetical protein